MKQLKFKKIMKLPHHVNVRIDNKTWKYILKHKDKDQSLSDVIRELLNQSMEAQNVL